MLHQVPLEWEVVDQYSVEPIRVYVEDDGELLGNIPTAQSTHTLIGATIVSLAPHEIVGAYTFDMAPSAPARPGHRKSHSHESAVSSQASNKEKATAAPRRSSHSPSPRPQPPVVEPIARTISPASLPNSTSSPTGSPKLRRLGSAFSFLRPHSNARPGADQHRRLSASSDDSHSGSGSGSSDGDSEAVSRKHLPESPKSTSSTGRRASLCLQGVAKKPTPAIHESPAYSRADLKRALIFARGELMKQVQTSGKNALVLEG